MKALTRIKTHLRENKKLYVGLGLGIVVGAAGAVLLTRNNAAIQANMTRIFSPGENNLVQIYLAPLGDPGNVVQCLETGTTYASQGELARSLGVNKSLVSQHLRGLLPDLSGKHYEVLGKAGQPIAA